MTGRDLRNFVFNHRTDDTGNYLYSNIIKRVFTLNSQQEPTLELIYHHDSVKTQMKKYCFIGFKIHTSLGILEGLRYITPYSVYGKSSGCCHLSHNVVF